MSSSNKKRSLHDKEDEKVKIYSMNVSRLPVNTSILGCIHEIKEYEISVILPGAIRAKLPITNISDPYSILLQEYTKAPTRTSCPKPRSMFASGQLLVVKVLDKSESNMRFEDSSLSLIDIEVSINPRDILSDLNVASFLANCEKLNIPAAVKSIEEHGFLMDIGFDDVTGFLSFDDAQSYISSHHFNKLAVGQVIFCHVVSSSKRIVKLTTKSPKALRDSPEKENFPLTCLIPGLTVSATIVSASSKGLEVVVFSRFKGFVHRDHLKSIWDLPNKDYEIGSQVTGMVLFVNPVTKTVALSLRLRKEVLSLRKIWSSIKIGEVIEDAQLVGKDEVNNFIFKLPNELKGIAPKSELSDEYLSDEDLAVIENRMPIGSSHKCRIKSISLIDGYVKVTLKPSLLEAQYISPDDLRVGMIMEGTVKKFSKKGLTIRLGFGAKAFCPSMHFIDKKFPNPSKCFAAGAKVKCRIIRLSRNSIVPKIAVTCRPALLKKKLLILDDINKATPGFFTKGVIALVQTNGILVEFFNELRGFISIKRLKKEDIHYSESSYQVGQILSVYVVDSDKKSKHIHLSLQLDDEITQGSKKKRKKRSEVISLSACTMLNNCLVTRKDSEGLYITHEKTGGIDLFLPKEHLSDFPGHITHLMGCFEAGDEMSNLMVFKCARNTCILTRKSLLQDAVKSHDNIFDINHIHPSSVLPAVVKCFKPYGIIMEMPGNIYGLVPTLYTGRPPIDPLNSPYALGQTLLVGVKDITEDDDGKKRIALSLLLKDCNSDDYIPSKILALYLEEYEIIRSKLSNHNPDPLLRAVNSHKIGDVVSFRVINSRDNEKLCDVISPYSKKPLKGFIFDDQLPVSGQTIKVGSSKDGVVLFSDLSKKCLILSPDDDLVKKVKSCVKNDSYRRVKSCQTLLSFVQFIANQYIMVSLQAHGIGAFAFINRYDHLNSLEPVKHQYSVGDRVYIEVDSLIETSNGQIIIVGRRSVTGSKERKLKQLRERQKKKNSGDTAQSEKTRKRRDSKISSDSDSGTSTLDDQPSKRKKLDNSDKTKDLKSKFYKKQQSNYDTKIKSALLDDEGFVWTERLPEPLSNVERGPLVESVDDVCEDNNSTKLSKEIIEKELADTPTSVTNWLNYINCYLREGDISKARECCKRSLERIDHRNEDDKLKIWMTKLKIEIDHGTPESTQALLKEALKANKELKILQGMIKIYESQEKIELAEQIHKIIIKKFYHDHRVWIDFGKFYLQRGMKDASRDIFQRSLKAVDKVHHIELITKFSQIDCQHGEIERAKSMMEAILVNFPKRTDIWSAYIDMIIKYGLKNNQSPQSSLEFIRLLFERAISMKIKPKKISFLFQKYIDFEKTYGDERRIPEINRKALEYAQSASTDANPV